MITAGPASGTASWSTKKMPVPTVAPTPNIVSWKVPKLRLELRTLVRALLLADRLAPLQLAAEGDPVRGVGHGFVPSSGGCVYGSDFRACQERGITRVGWYPPGRLTGCPP